MEDFPNRYERYIDLPRLLSTLRPEPPADLTEITLRCAFSASELSFILVDDAAADARPSFDGKGLIDRVLNSTAALIEAAEDLLARAGAALPEQPRTKEPSRQTGLAALARLPPSHLRPIDRLTRALLCAFQGRPYRLGVEPAAQELRRGLGLPALPDADGEVPFIPYDAWVRPAALRAMPHGAEVPYGPEDRRFALTHQVLECWFVLFLHLLRSAQEHAQRRAWDEAAFCAARTAELLQHLSPYRHLLEHMVVADFHPLRVALGGASLAESRAAVSILDITRALFDPLDAALGGAGVSLLDVLQRPERTLGEHCYLNALRDMEVAAAGFFFDRPGSPLFPKLDAAKARLTELADLSAARHRGCFFAGDDGDLTKSATTPIPEAQMGVPPERLRAIVATYFALMTAGEPEAFAHLFASDGYIEDPRGSSKWRGEAELSAYVSTFLKRFPGTKIAPSGEVAVKGNVATAPWSARGGIALGEERSFAGEATFYFKSTGQISAVLMDWDPRALGEKLGYIERYRAGEGVLRPLTVAVLGHPNGPVAKELKSALGQVPTRTWLPRKLFHENLAVEAIKWLSACDEMGPGFPELLRGASCAVVLVQPADLAGLPDLAPQIAASVKAAGVRRLAWVVPGSADGSVGAALEEANTKVADAVSALMLRHEPLFSHLLLCRDDETAPSQLLLPDAARPIRFTSSRDIATFLSRWIKDELPLAKLHVKGPEALTGPDLARIIALAAQRTDAGRAAAERRFQQIDHNADGALSKDELRAYLHAVGYGPGAVEAALERADRDADGSLSFEEFSHELGAALGAVLGSLAAEISCIEVPAAALSARLVKRGFTAAAASAFVACLGPGEEQSDAPAGEESSIAAPTPLSAWAFEHAVQFMDVHILPGKGVVATREAPREGVAGTESRLLRPDGQTLICWRAKEQSDVRLRWGEADQGDVTTYRYAEGESERVLLVRGEKLVGITAQGAWGGLRDASELIFSGERVPGWKLTLFTHLGDLSLGDPEGDAGMMVCTCAKVTREKLVALIDEGHQTMTGLCNASRSVKFCGACRAEIEGILSERTRSSLLPQAR